jgi:hypothetical protein
MDETIIRLRKWQLERHITNDEQELNMSDLALSSEDCNDLTADTAESDNREQAITNSRLHHDFQMSQSKEAVMKSSCSWIKVPFFSLTPLLLCDMPLFLHQLATIGSLLSSQVSSRLADSFVDLSRLRDQDKVICSEFDKNPLTIEQLEKEIEDSNFRRIMDEVKDNCWSMMNSKQLLKV